MKRIFSISLSLIMLFSLSAMAQQKGPSVSWDKTTHDFGTFKEENGKQTCSFIFKNTGSENLVITNVKASCGCTSPEWTQTPVKPGEDGYVKVTYDPKNRPNKFNKSITVTTNATPPTTILRITGNVTPREKTIEDFYPKVYGDLRLKTSHVAFVKIKNTEVQTEKLEIVNMSEKPVTVDFANVPEHIKLEVTPKTLQGMKPGEKHGQKGEIIITYDAKAKDDYGFNIDRLYLVLNGEKNYQNRLSVSATIEEDFSHLSPEELANAPHAEFESTEFEFGTIKQQEKVSYKYKFTNTGKTDLVIRKIKASCGCTATSPEKDVIKPGETSFIDVTFNSAGKRGKQRKTITVITNDPKESTTRLTISGVVEV
jgi:archaellum component FlaG (FlaF/FlaG flagellin family)